MGGILTTIYNHSFHCSCISKWTDSSCPVYRYCQQQPEKSICSIFETSENLWMCIICGFVGCVRYKEGHAIMHWKETEHSYSLKMETQCDWDYIHNEYNELLTSQLDKQRMCIESRVQKYKEEVEKEISKAVQKIYENHMKNEEIWMSKILEVGEREKKVLRLKDEKIYKLETHVRM
ncbi:hypothetical protein GIB67_017830 [Kingdonia uniflora]|uniref:UBP-type domain-containing protein n=1 Tax=Kingdonia uniflora TaxID=39325 RepID=A0A7J7MPC9_9MAGN|nr:hypothetical protein GIB67_017830 [Kingdonia uniflora]